LVFESRHASSSLTLHQVCHLLRASSKWNRSPRHLCNHFHPNTTSSCRPVEWFCLKVDAKQAPLSPKHELASFNWNSSSFPKHFHRTLHF
jgi:hypothetical protein